MPSSVSASSLESALRQAINLTSPREQTARTNVKRRACALAILLGKQERDERIANARLFQLVIAARAKRTITITTAVSYAQRQRCARRLGGGKKKKKAFSSKRPQVGARRMEWGLCYAPHGGREFGDALQTKRRDSEKHAKPQDARPTTRGQVPAPFNGSEATLGRHVLHRRAVKRHVRHRVCALSGPRGAAGRGGQRRRRGGAAVAERGKVRQRCE